MKCLLCQEPASQTLVKQGRFAVRFCTTCGIGFTCPQPTAEERATINAENYPLANRIATYQERAAMFEARYRRVLHRIKALGGKGRLLDIGCNIGKFLEVARQEGFSVTGVEINQACAEYGRRTFQLEIYDQPLEEIHFPQHCFEVITLFDVLEHVPDGFAFLREVHRILSPQGLLVVQAPNLESAMAEHTGSEWYWLAMPDHLLHFTPRSLARFLENSDFRILKRRTWEPVEDYANNVIATLGPPGWPGRLFRFLLRTSRLVEFKLRLDRHQRWTTLRGGLIEMICRPEHPELADNPRRKTEGQPR